MSDITLFNQDGRILASSRDVAEKFRKRHQEVVYAIEGRKCNCDGNSKCKKCNGRGYIQLGILQENEISVESHLSKMFIKTPYKDSMNRTKYEYLMNRDGFSLLCMGFTGKKALEWKLKYIDAFNKMEDALKSVDYLSEEEKLKLQLFSKDPLEVASAHNRLVELEVVKATAPLIPKAEYHDAIEVASNCVNFGKFSATLQNKEGIKLGRNTIMDWCRDKGYLCSSIALKNKPSQQMLSNGYMQYKQNTNERNGKTYINYTPLLTGKGEIWLTKQLIKEFC